MTDAVHPAEAVKRAKSDVSLLREIGEERIATDLSALLTYIESARGLMREAKQDLVMWVTSAKARCLSTDDTEALIARLSKAIGD